MRSRSRQHCCTSCHSPLDVSSSTDAICSHSHLHSVAILFTHLHGAMPRRQMTTFQLSSGLLYSPDDGCILLRTCLRYAYRQCCKTSHTYAGAVYVSTLRLVIRVMPGIFFGKKKLVCECKYIRACVRILHTGLSLCYLKVLLCVCVCVHTHTHTHTHSSSEGLTHGR